MNGSFPQKWNKLSSSLTLKKIPYLSLEYQNVENVWLKSNEHVVDYDQLLPVQFWNAFDDTQTHQLNKTQDLPSVFRSAALSKFRAGIDSFPLLNVKWNRATSASFFILNGLINKLSRTEPVK